MSDNATMLVVKGNAAIALQPGIPGEFLSQITRDSQADTAINKSTWRTFEHIVKLLDLFSIAPGVKRLRFGNGVANTSRNNGNGHVHHTAQCFDKRMVKLFANLLCGSLCYLQKKVFCVGRSIFCHAVLQLITMCLGSPGGEPFRRISSVDRHGKRDGLESHPERE